MAALAESVQSSTTVNLTFRDCIAGGTACGAVGTAIKTYAGFPGDQTAQADADNNEYGTTSGSAELVPTKNLVHIDLLTLVALDR